MSIKVYFAGKISGTNWRQRIFPSLPSFVRRTDESECEERLTGASFTALGPTVAGITYCGPFWVECNHTYGNPHEARNCYTGEASHQMGQGRAGYLEGSGHGSLCGAEAMKDTEIVSRCLAWIDRADAVFALIDEADLYGTFAELGYARAIGKPIWVYQRDYDCFLYARPCAKDLWEQHRVVYRETWFARGLADFSFQVEDIDDAWEHFSGHVSARLRPLLLRRMPYADYLQTDHWKEMRRRALAAAEYRCQVCNGSEDLEAHHRTYERRGEELLTDLTVLCASCHGTFHGKGKLQTSELPSQTQRRH